MLIFTQRTASRACALFMYAFVLCCVMYVIPDKKWLIWTSNYRQPLLDRPHQQNLLQSKEAHWYAVPTILQLYQHIYYSNTLFDAVRPHLEYICKPSLGSVPGQGLQDVGRRSEVCL